MSFSARILGRKQRPALRHGLVALVLASAGLAACGQKGALFLPPESAQATAPVAPLTVPAVAAPIPSASAAR